MSNYRTINENNDFIEDGFLFVVNGEMYEYNGVIHDEELVFGIRCFGVDMSERKFKFSEVTQIYKPLY